MVFFTFLYGRSFHWPLMLVLWLGFALAGHLPAQTNAISVQASPAADTNQIPVAPIATNMPETNTAPVAVAPTSEPAPNAEPKPAVAVLQATLPPAAVPQPA